MIGSSTLIVKENGEYNIHVCDAYISISIRMGIEKLKKEFHDIYDLFVDMDKDWRTKGYNNKEIITENTVKEILVSHHCIEDKKDTMAGYSKYAGDGIFLLDYDTQKLFARAGGGGKEEWKEINWDYYQK